MAGGANVATGTGTCSAKGKPPVKPSQKQKPVFCDVKELRVVLFDGAEGDYYGGPGEGGGYKAVDPEKRKVRPPKVPDHLAGHLKSYDLVLELMATEIDRSHGQVNNEPLLAARRSGFGKAAGRNQIPPSSVTAKADWKVSCADKDHKLLRLKWKDGESTAAAGQQLKEKLSAGPMYRDITEPMGVLKDLWDHQKCVMHYHLTAESCGRPSAGKKTQGLNALILTHPVDQFGVVFEVNLPKFSFGWSPAKANQSIDAETQKLKQDAKRIQFPAKRGRLRKAREKAYQKAWNKADAQRKSLLLKAERLNNPKGAAAALLGDARHGIERGDAFDWGFIINDETISKDDLKGYRSTLTAVNDFLGSAKTATEKVTEVMTFMTKYSPAVVQPQMALEVGGTTGEFVFSTRYRKDDEGERWKSVARQALLEAEFVLLQMSGTIALVIGKAFRASEVTATGSVTVELAFWVETKIHFAKVKDVQSLWKEIKDYFQIKTMTGFVGRVEGRATAIGYELATAGGAVRGSIVWDSWEFRPAVKCVANCAPVVLEFYANSKAVGKGKEKSWVVQEASSTPRTLWTW